MHLRRNADVGDDDVARLRLAWRQHERKLRRRQRHRHRGANALADRLGVIGRQAARQIDGDDRNARGVDVGGDRFHHAGERRLEAGAEDRVDDEVALGDFREVEIPGLLVGNLDDGQAQTAEDLEVQPRIALDGRHRRDDEHRDVDAALMQRARDDEAVAAVVAGPAQHGDLPVGRDRRTRLRAPRRPAARRSPSAPSTECRSRRWSDDRRPASERHSARASD